MSLRFWAIFKHGLENGSNKKGLVSLGIVGTTLQYKVATSILAFKTLFLGSIINVLS